MFAQFFSSKNIQLYEYDYRKINNKCKRKTIALRKNTRRMFLIFGKTT